MGKMNSILAIHDRGGGLEEEVSVPFISCIKWAWTEEQKKRTMIHFLLMRAMVLSRFSRVQFLITPWTVARQVPPSMGFSRQEDWSGLLCPPPGDLPNPGIEPTSLMSPALAGGFFTTSATRKAPEW